MEIICIDTNLLIDYFRKPDKPETKLYKLAANYTFAISAVTFYEFWCGQENKPLDEFLTKLFEDCPCLPFDRNVAEKAAELYANAKKQNKNPGMNDLFIAATVIAWGYKLATKNHKHFDAIPGIILV